MPLFQVCWEYKGELGIWETLFLFLFDYIFFKLLFLPVKLFNSIDDTFMRAHLRAFGH